jgi:hypothetical protein
MKQVQPYRFYELGAQLHDLFNFRLHARLADMFLPLTEAQKSLDALVKGELVPLRAATSEAQALLTQIGGLFNKYFIDPANRQLRFPAAETQLDEQEMRLLGIALQRFESALAADMSQLMNFIAAQRGIYNTEDLIENARRAIAFEVIEHVPTAALQELDAAGRALGFEIGTASAMHALRALELATAQYYELFDAPLSNRNERNLATYIRRLASLAEEEGNRLRPDARLVQMLSQVKETYRNPIMFSDVVIETAAAMNLFGMVTNLIGQMAAQIASHRARPVRVEPKKLSGSVISPIRDDAKVAPEPEKDDTTSVSQDDLGDTYDFRVSGVR